MSEIEKVTPEPPARNVLAYEVWDAIQKNRHHFDMAYWAKKSVDDLWSDNVISLADLLGDRECGTTACLAGWTATMAGYRVAEGGAVMSAEGGMVINPDVADFAAGLLGLAKREADYLFLCADEEIEERFVEVFGPRPDPTA